MYTPEPKRFAILVIDEIDRAGMREKTNIQSFDLRTLQVIHEMDASIVLAFLIANTKSVAQNIEELGFVPEIYSPNYRLVTPQMIEEAHSKQMKVIPWTVNEKAAMKSMKVMGVDGIITDYPNYIEDIDRGQ